MSEVTIAAVASAGSRSRRRSSSGEPRAASTTGVAKGVIAAMFQRQVVGNYVKRRKRGDAVAVRARAA